MFELLSVDRKFDDKDIKSYMDRLLRFLSEVSTLQPNAHQKHEQLVPHTQDSGSYEILLLAPKANQMY